MGAKKRPKKLSLRQRCNFEDKRWLRLGEKYENIFCPNKNTIIRLKFDNANTPFRRRGVTNEIRDFVVRPRTRYLMRQHAGKTSMTNVYCRAERENKTFAWSGKTLQLERGKKASDFYTRRGNPDGNEFDRSTVDLTDPRTSTKCFGPRTGKKAKGYFVCARSRCCKHRHRKEKERENGRSNASPIISYIP